MRSFYITNVNNLLAQIPVVWEFHIDGRVAFRVVTQNGLAAKLVIAATEITHISEAEQALGAFCSDHIQTIQNLVEAGFVNTSDFFRIDCGKIAVVAGNSVFVYDGVTGEYIKEKSLF